MNAKIWGRWVTRLFQNRRAARRAQPALIQRRLAFEYLEDRVVPATISWTGAGGNSFWSTIGNWNLGRAPLAGDDIVFSSLAPAASRSTVDDLAGLPLYSTITVSASGYTLGGTIAVPKLALSGSINVGANVGTTSISIDIKLLPPLLVQTFTVGPGSTLTVSGHLSGSDTPLTAAQQTLTKAGAGTLELTTNNSTFTGAFTLANNGGILRITHPLALGAGAAVAGAPTAGFTTVNPNSQLQYSNLSDPVTARLRLNGVGVASDGALLNVAGNNAQAGAVILDADASIGGVAGTALNITGQISDTGAGHNFAKEGQGQLIFSRVGGNIYRGQTVINNGILTIRDPLSLGAGADATKPQSGQPQSGTIVNFNSVTGDAGTLQLEFVPGTLTANDPNGILQNPILPFQPFPALPNFNPYIGFQVFNDLLTLNGPGFGNIGALHNLAGDNAWDGDIIFGSPPPSQGNINIGVAANTNLTISGVISDPNRAPRLDKILPGRLILNNANTYDGGTLVSAGVLNVRDSRALSTGAVRVLANAALELEVDQGLDGTYTRDAQGNLVPLRSHNRNLGFDSVNLTVAGVPGQGQEVFVPGASGTFRLQFKGQTTAIIDAASATLAADIQAALNALSTIGGVGGSVAVTKSGNVYRVIFGGSLATANIPLMVAVSGTATAVVSPIYGLNVANTISSATTGGLQGTGIANTGALRSISGINEYSGLIQLGGTSDVNNGSVGVAPDARPGHFTAGTDYFIYDNSLTMTGTMVDWDAPILNDDDSIFTGTVNTGHFSNLTKFGTGHLILPFQNTYSGKTDILAGWVTAQNNNSLGTKIGIQSSTNWQPTTVFSGAALHLKPLAGAAAPNLIHTYDLNGSLADALGGPALVANGGTLNATNYSFGPNQGLTLTGALAEPRQLLDRDDLQPGHTLGFPSAHRV